MMPISSPKFKHQSDDEPVPTIRAQHLDKDFVSAQQFPTSPTDASIHTRGAICRNIQDDSWIPYPMGELLDTQSKSPPSSASSSFPPSSSFMTESLKSVDPAPLSLDIGKSDDSST